MKIKIKKSVLKECIRKNLAEDRDFKTYEYDTKRIKFKNVVVEYPAITEEEVAREYKHEPLMLRTNKLSTEYGSSYFICEVGGSDEGMGVGFSEEEDELFESEAMMISTTPGFNTPETYYDDSDNELDIGMKNFAVRMYKSKFKPNTQNGIVKIVFDF